MLYTCALHIMCRIRLMPQNIVLCYSAIIPESNQILFIFHGLQWKHTDMKPEPVYIEFPFILTLPNTLYFFYVLKFPLTKAPAVHIQ